MNSDPPVELRAYVLAELRRVLGSDRGPTWVCQPCGSRIVVREDPSTIVVEISPGPGAKRLAGVGAVVLESFEQVRALVAQISAQAWDCSDCRPAGAGQASPAGPGLD
jgi:ribosomal protein L37AE/L43A